MKTIVLLKFWNLNILNELFHADRLDKLSFHSTKQYFITGKYIWYTDDESVGTNFSK
jgi:hypothetical protein